MNLIEPVIAALHEHVGQEPRDQTAWGDIVEDSHIVDMPERREYLGSFRLVENRPIWSLQLTHCAIAVYRHYQRITEFTRLREVTNVSHMQ